MQLKHLIQAYNFNGLQAKEIEEYEETEERAGVIQFSENINAAYLLDEENIVIDMIIFCSCITKQMKLDKQIQHTIETIKVLQKTIELIANLPQRESNMILEKLGMFDGTFKEEKQIKHLQHSFSISTYKGLLRFEIKELVDEQQLL